MKKSLLLLPVLLGLAAGIKAAGQTIPVSTKFGDVSKAELSLETYAPDTSAAAVILYAKHEVLVGYDFQLTATRKETITKRYKVLKESGKECADFKILYLSKDNQEKIIGIKVTTYNLEGGKIVQSKISKKMIFDEKFSNSINQISFSAPDVRVGSVIEIQYILNSERFWDIGTIFMQQRYPVNFAELNIEYAEFFIFNKLARGFYNFKDTNTSSRMAVFSTGTYGNPMDYKIITDYYSGVDIPAIKAEPYNFYPDQSRLGVEYELREIFIPGGFSKDYSSTWETVDEQFISSGLIRECNGNNKLAAEVKAEFESAANEKEAIETVRKFVLDKVRWNDKVAFFPNVSKALKEGSGDQADICGTAACVLNSLGYKADPVLVKTRNRGVLADFHVSTDAFNALILRITTPSGAIYYTDIVRPETYLNVLPSTYLVARARVIDASGKGSWADISKISKSTIMRSYNLNVAEDGTVSGKATISANNEAAWSMKARYTSFKDKEEYIADVEKDNGIEISSFEFSGSDKWSNSASLSYDFELKADATGDRIYLQPFFDKPHSESDFQSTLRTSPVEFSFPYTLKASFNITWPEGYEIEQMPANMGYGFDLAKSKAIVQYARNGENSLSISYLFILGHTYISENDYMLLRKYWNELCSIYKGTLVLRKK